MKRLGLMGVGAWGHRYIETIARRGDCRIVAYARASNGTEPAVANAVACRSVDELVCLGKAGELDGVIVATTAESQPQLAQALLAAGLPVLCEKPLGLSQDAVRGLDAWLSAQDVPPPLMVDYVHLFAPAYVALKRRISELPANRIQTVESVGCNAGPYRGWSSLYDYGAHELSLVFDLLGQSVPCVLRSAQRVVAAEGTRGELYDVDLVARDVSIHLLFGNGSKTKQRRLNVVLDSGQTLTYDDCEPVDRKLTVDSQPIRIEQTAPLDCVLSHFLLCCEAWRLRQPPPMHVAMELDFSARVAACLDQIGCAIAEPK